MISNHQPTLRQRTVALCTNAFTCGGSSAQVRNTLLERKQQPIRPISFTPKTTPPFPDTSICRSSSTCREITYTIHRFSSPANYPQFDQKPGIASCGTAVSPRNLARSSVRARLRHLLPEILVKNSVSSAYFTPLLPTWPCRVWSTDGTSRCHPVQPVQGET